MFQNAHYKKSIFQELISRVLLEIETRGQVFCLALGPVTIYIAIQTIGLLYLFYNTGWHFKPPEIVQRLDKLRKSVGSFVIRCDLRCILGCLEGTKSSWAVPEKTVKKTLEKWWFMGVKTALAWPLQYFLLMAGVWSFCDTFLRPKSKIFFFLFFQMLIRCWYTRVQI